MNRPVRGVCGQCENSMGAEFHSLSIVQNNPFRILGVYTNTSTKAIVANVGKAKAFLKVNREITFPSDFNQILPHLMRNVEVVANAESQLTLPSERIKYALFWFIRVNPLDDIAFNHLDAGSITNAIAIWDKKECFSSLLNKATCAYIQGNLSLAVNSMMRLLQNTIYREEFFHAIIDETFCETEEALIYAYLDLIIQEVGNDSLSILACIDDTLYEDYVREKITSPLKLAIETEIDKAQKVTKNDSSARYNAVDRLIGVTKPLLAQLKSLLLVTDMQYQMIADKLGLEILQCGIDYFNNSQEVDTAFKAMRVQKYALSVVVGKMAADRCKENVDILQKILADLPPTEVFEEDKMIKDELSKFVHLPNSVSCATDLLQKTRPQLQSIKIKMGDSNSYYLRMSTQVVGNALYNIIEEVNQKQNELSQAIELLKVKYPYSYSYNDTSDPLFKYAIGHTNLIPTLNSAWNAIKIMDNFDLEYKFKLDRYNANRKVLKELCEQFHIETRTSGEKTIQTVKNVSEGVSGPSWGYVIGVIVFWSAFLAVIIWMLSDV